MKRRINLSIVLIMSIVLLSLITSDSTARTHGAVWLTVGFFEVNAPVQTVEVNTPRDSYDAVFHNEVQVRNGAANGFLTLTGPDSGARHSVGLNVLLSDGSVRFNRNGTLSAVRLRGRNAEGGRITIIISPAATEDCLIYTTVGTDVTATFEVEGTLTLIAD